MKKLTLFLSLLAGLLMLLQVSLQAAAPPHPSVQGPVGAEKIAPEIQQALQALHPGQMLTVIVTLKEQTELRRLTLRTEPDRAVRLRSVVETLQSRANLSQQALKTLLSTRQAQGRVGQVTYFWIFNGLVVTATPAVIFELAARPEVLRITPNETIQAPPLLPKEQGGLGILAAELNLNLINVPALWARGYKGQGIVVASMDTGVDVDHPQLGPRWRGGTNSWYDPYGQHPNTPTDLAASSSGHGTRTMGIMVGGEDNNGNAFGVAPEAKWIAVKVFRNDGSGTTVGFHAGFQWLLDPDGNPATPDAPHVVNNSWVFSNPNSCSLTFQADLQALRAAGILPIFAAGNAGPNPSTSYSPPNNPEALAVGSINNSNVIYSLSSRGPLPTSPPGCDDGTVFPEVVAPGVSIRTSDLYNPGIDPPAGTYTLATGTSFAAPHVTGVLALLLEAAPNLTVAQQETGLLNSPVDLGAIGPDNSYGRGRIDALATFQSLFDLSVIQSASSNSTVNDPLTYTIAVINNGPLTATTVTLAGTLPSNVIFGSVASTQGSCTGTGALTCVLGNLASGATVTVTLSVTPTLTGLITNTISVAGLKPDLDLQNDTATATTMIFRQVFLPLLIQ